MPEQDVLFAFKLFGVNIDFTTGFAVQWAIIILAAIIFGLSTRNLKKIPDKKQTVLEWFVGTVNNLVKENMGEKYVDFFVPFIGAVMIYLLIMNLSGLVGVEPPTSDLSVAAGMGALTFILIQSYTIKKVGLKHYFIGYTKPMALLLPINIMERFMLPVSLSLRLYGNMLAGGVILNMVYSALGYFGVALPIPFHFYFDVFDGGIQMFIFIMLTMINTKVIVEH